MRFLSSTLPLAPLPTAGPALPLGSFRWRAFWSTSPNEPPAPPGAAPFAPLRCAAVSVSRSPPSSCASAATAAGFFRLPSDIPRYTC
jgi:hypothetical protein